MNTLVKARPPDQIPEEAIALLGTTSDRALAERFQLSPYFIKKARLSLGIMAFSSAHPPLPAEAVELLGKVKDSDLARRFGLPKGLIFRQRELLKIPSYRIRPGNKKPTGHQAISLTDLGQMSDADTAKMLGMSVWRVAKARRNAKIPAFRAPKKPEQVTQPFEAEKKPRAARPRPIPEKDLGRMSDLDTATMLGETVNHIATDRRAANPRYRSNVLPQNQATQQLAARLAANPSELALLGCKTDQAVAIYFGVRSIDIARLREIHGVQAFGRKSWTPELLCLLGKIPDPELVKRSCGTLTLSAVRKKRNKLKIPVCRAPLPVATGGAAASPEVIALLGKLNDYEIAEVTGVQRSCITLKRKSLGIAPARRKRPRKEKTWTTEELALLGKLSDREVAEKVGLCCGTVASKRQSLGIAPGKCRLSRSWTSEELALLGNLLDREVAAKVGLTKSAVAIKRQSLGIASARPRHSRSWTSEELALLGTLFDREVAAKVGLSTRTVAMKRQTLGIAPASRRLS